MELYVDTADVEAVREYAAMGVVDGVTTNPSIVADDGRPYREVVGAVDRELDGPVFAQVVAETADGMVEEARAYQEWGDEVVAKIPATRDGFEALHRLREAGVPAGITVVFSVEQAMLAAKNDATFVAPYVGRIEDAGDDGVGTVERIQAVFDAYGFSTDVLAASIRTTRQATECYAVGVDSITMGPDVLSAHVSTPETDESLAGFAEDWDGRGSPLAGSTEGRD
jgi:transaldolase